MRKQHVSAEQFVDYVLVRMRRGMSYENAAAPYTTDVEVEPARGADGVKEVSESTLITTDLEALEVRVLAYLEEDAHDADRYTAVGWQGPPEDPAIELAARTEEAFEFARRRRLYDAVRALSKQEQAVIHAMFWEDTPQANIARGLGISRQAVNSAYQRAIGKLREAYGLPPEGPAKARRRLTQDEMDKLVLTRQRRRGHGVDKRLARLRKAGLA